MSPKVAIRVFGITIVVVSFLGVPRVYGQYSTYSGDSADPSGVYGWGVTDVTNYSYSHTAKVSATLQSPNGRTAQETAGYNPNSARADVFLSLDWSDMGTYQLTTTHWGNCLYMGAIIAGLVLIRTFNLSIQDFHYEYTSTFGSFWLYNRCYSGGYCDLYSVLPSNVPGHPSTPPGFVSIQSLTVGSPSNNACYPIQIVLQSACAYP
ncbi:MAG: hypothetical protein L0387_21875 [Acidobacteria bacterium]|nr:hypothetical protein [Acidobacteriota bacterium]